MINVASIAGIWPRKFGPLRGVEGALINMTMSLARPLRPQIR